MPVGGSASAVGGLGGRGGSGVSRSASRLPEYVRRLGSYAAMDMDFALWQMVHLVLAPSRVWRMAKFHRQTKGQWARDGTWRRRRVRAGGGEATVNASGCFGQQVAGGGGARRGRGGRCHARRWDRFGWGGGW